MPTSVTVVCLFLFLSEGIHGSQDISCNFNDDWCKWNTDENTTLQWIRNDNQFWELTTEDYHLELNMDNAKVNDTGRLLSPWLQGSFNQTCQLRFIYSLGNHNACQLSVWLRTQPDVPIVLNTLRDTNTFDKSPYINIPCTAESYQIIIEGKKVSNEPCGTIYNKLGLYDLTYIIHQATDGERNSIGDNGQHSDNNDRDKGLSKEAAAGIAVAFNNVVVVAVIAAFFLIRKRTKKQEHADDGQSRSTIPIHTSNDISSNQHFADSSHSQDHTVPSRVSDREDQYLTPVNRDADSNHHNTRHITPDVLANQNNPYESLNRDSEENRPYDALFVNR